MITQRMEDRWWIIFLLISVYLLLGALSNNNWIICPCPCLTTTSGRMERSGAEAGQQGAEWRSHGGQTRVRDDPLVTTTRCSWWAAPHNRSSLDHPSIIIISSVSTKIYIYTEESLSRNLWTTTTMTTTTTTRAENGYSGDLKRTSSWRNTAGFLAANRSIDWEGDDDDDDDEYDDEDARRRRSVTPLSISIAEEEDTKRIYS